MVTSMVMKSYQERPSVVIDFGTRYIKCGFSSESAPREIIPWTGWTSIRMAPQDKPCPTSQEEWTQELNPLIEHICTVVLQLTPQDRRFIIAEDLLAPRYLREALGEIILRRLQAKSICFQPGLIMPMFSTGQTTVLVVDSGWIETRCLPIVDGSYLFPLLNTMEDCSGFHICSTLASRLQPQYQFKEDLDFDLLEDILVRCCFVDEREAQNQSISSMNYNMIDSDGQTSCIQIDASTRSLPGEILFSDDDHSIASCILDTVGKAPIDVRVALLKNIVLIGGLACIPGYAYRLKEEMVDLVTTQKKYHHLDKVVNVHQLEFLPPYVPPNVMCWTGASIYGALEISRTDAMTLEQYQHNHSRVFDRMLMKTDPNM